MGWPVCSGPDCSLLEQDLNISMDSRPAAVCTRTNIGPARAQRGLVCLHNSTGPLQSACFDCFFFGILCGFALVDICGVFGAGTMMPGSTAGGFFIAPGSVLGGMMMAPAST